jgi:cell division protein FtsW (lipid II flippase)
LDNWKTLAFAIFGLFAFLFLMFAPIYGNMTINRMRSAFKFKQDASYEVRNVNRASVQPYIKSHPLGGGLMTTGVMSLKYNPGHPLAGFPPDSGLLKYALETGWVGLILLCTLYFIILQQGAHAFYRAREPEHKAFILAALVGLFANIIAQYSQVAIGATPELFFFYPAIAIIVKLSKLENKENQTI